MSRTLSKNGLYKALHHNIAIIVILIGIALVSLTIGPFQNPDTAWEYKAANGVIQWGMPFVEVQGSLINQPPLGFYAEGLFLKTFGVTIETGSVLILLFGLGSTLLVFALGKTLYNKQSGILAATLFALSPWQLVLSNTFLIDTQCLFLSLASLYIGIISMQKDSNKLLFCSGVLFALAFYTKLFAVFVLIPLLLFYMQSQLKKLGRIPVKLALFFLPLIFATMIWYTVDFYLMPSYLPKGLGYLFNHPDFSDFNQAGLVPSYSFVGVFLLDYGLGYYFLGAFIFSLIAGLALKNRIDRRLLVTDWIFVMSIILISATTMYLGVTVNLKVPYTSTIKYVYQALPLFCLVTASLALKCTSIVNFAQYCSKMKKAVLFTLGAFGLLLLALSILYSIFLAHQLSASSFIVFRVQPDQLLGYSFDNFHAIAQNSNLLYIQYLGFALIISSLVYSTRQYLYRLLTARKCSLLINPPQV